MSSVSSGLSKCSEKVYSKNVTFCLIAFKVKYTHITGKKYLFSCIILKFVLH